MKKVFTTLSVFAIMLAMVASAAAQTTFVKVGFHCNAGKGNGKTNAVFTATDTPYNGKDLVGLVQLTAQTWTLAGEFECETCKRTDWVLFSNNGKLNGNNFQLNHGETPTYRAPVLPPCDHEEMLCKCCGECTECDCDCGCEGCDDCMLVDLASMPNVVNLGFIGYYTYDFGGENGVRVLSTSIHWQNLEEGDMIDWVAVDEAYDAWIAQGGLAPERALWQTSGYGSYTFEDYAPLGFGDFDDLQLENYYLAYYVDPGYVLPYVCSNFCEGECGLCLDCGDCECPVDFLQDDYVCECECTLVCKGGNGNCVPCDGVCVEDGGCDCKCKCTLWPGKGCQNCQGNEGGKGQPLCDGSGWLNGKRCSQGQQ